jgi:hypothetical protein
MRKNGKQVDAELRGHGEWGWECQFFYYNDELAYGRRWVARADALREAEEKRCEGRMTFITRAVRNAMPVFSRD